MNSIALLLVIPAAFVFTFKTPTFDINRLISVSLAAVPAVTSAICCPALSHACVVILFVTLAILSIGAQNIEKANLQCYSPR